MVLVTCSDIMLVVESLWLDLGVRRQDDPRVFTFSMQCRQNLFSAEQYRQALHKQASRF